jgi:hypothetical protein
LALSFSGGSGRSFGGGKKGFSPSQKKDKKKKQEFHKHKVKFNPEGQVDFEELKNRVTIALDRLGTQVFSGEPGAYDIKHWTSSFDLLLDDFEEKASPDTLPKEYFDSRQRLTAELLSPVDTSAIDTEIHNLESLIVSIQEKIAEINRRAEIEKNQERSDSASKIDELRKERQESDVQITRAKSTLEEQKKAESRQSIFGKLFTRSSASSSKSTQGKIDSLSARKDQIDRDLQSIATARARKLASKKDRSAEVASLQAELETQQQALGESEAQKQEKLQLSEKRKQVTKSLSEIISQLQLRTEPVASSNE